MSLMQQGRLARARAFVAAVYNANKDKDNKLVDMARGVWSRLRFAYLKRKKKKK